MFLIDGRFGVCGHNYEYADDGRCSFWDYARKHDIESKMRDLGIGDVVVQGEFCAAGIQKNPLKLTRPEWYIFTVYDPLTRRAFLPGQNDKTLRQTLPAGLLPLKSGVTTCPTRT